MTFTHPNIPVGAKETMGVSSETEPPSRTGQSKYLHGFSLLETAVILATLLLKRASAPNRAASACFGVSPRYKCKHMLFYCTVISSCV